MSTFEIVNVGALPNDGEGDPLRVAFQKINNNFANLYATATSTTLSTTIGLTPNQVIWELPTSLFTHGTFQIRSTNPDTVDTQDITITAQLLNNSNGIKWTGFATTFNGDAVTQYNMDVLSGNVRILANPIANAVLEHFIASTTSYYVSVAGLSMMTEDEEGLVTELNNVPITTEN